MNKISVAEWLPAYEKIVRRRLEAGQIKDKTFGDYRRMMLFISETWKDIPVADITVSDIAAAVHKKADLAPFSARRLRINLSNFFTEAQRAGEIPLGHNPVLVSKYPAAQVATERLMLNEWLRIFKSAKYIAPDYFEIAMLLALVTAQRSSDLIKMHRNDISNGLLHIEQFKTGEKIALPLELKLDIIGTSLSDILSICPDSGFLLQNHRGKQINTWSLSRWFRMCRRQASITANAGGLLPSFREQRSLSERLYREQGVDTMTLLGHKYQKMTDSYNDIRRKAFRQLKL